MSGVDGKKRGSTVAVIGAGFFGAMTALGLAEKGMQVTLFEKSADIMTGASYINQNRIHMGYHYPRSDETAKAAHTHQKAFRKLFDEAVVDDFDHYYCVAGEGSRVTPRDYLDFCVRMGLHYKKEFPRMLTISRDTVDLAIKVPEKIYDADTLRALVQKKLAAHENLSLRCSTEVVGIQKRERAFVISHKNGKSHGIGSYNAVINATYSNINRIVSMAGYRTKEYQYELCEVAVVRVPWKKKTGCAIMDGPFFGILPFGFSNEYLLYDVEYSVLERSVGKFPEFRCGISYYDKKDVRASRFQKYIAKAARYIKECSGVSHLRSIYVTRIVLPKRDHDDARPSEVIRHGNRFWSIFAGKVSMALPIAEEIAKEVSLELDRV